MKCKLKKLVLNIADEAGAVVCSLVFNAASWADNRAVQ